MHTSLFDPVPAPKPPPPVLTAWRPRSLAHDQWPPDYRRVFVWRIEQLDRLRSDEALLRDAWVYYSTRPAEFIMHWCDTYNPRKQTDKWMPFVLFERQREFIDFIEGLRRDGESGLVEKCRDVGASWLCVAYSVWCLIFLKDDSTGWGSRKQDLVDRIGDMDSLFEKMRVLYNRLPDVWKVGRVKDGLMKITNEENGASITGESGDNIGRGGRKSRYFKDEAQPLTAGILTPYGWQTMGDMVVGSQVCGPDGSVRTVTHINDCGEHQCYRITLVDGTSVTASEGHLWSVVNRKTGKTEIIRTVEMVERYRYESPRGRTFFRYSMKPSGIVNFAVDNSDLPLHPYIVGVLIGDGSVASVPRCRPLFTSADPEIAEYFASVAPDDCCVRYSGDGYTYRFGDAEGRRGRFKVSRASQRVMDAGVAGLTADIKHIPAAYKFRSADERLELLRGLMDTDGSASGGTLTYHTCSRTLADDVRFLVQSLGGRASLNTKPDHRGYRDMYCLHIVFADGTIPFRLTRKIKAMKPRKKEWGHGVVNIEPIGKQTVRCITVDNDDGLYLTDNCIVTHNSAHYAHPDLIEAALGDNTDVQIDISSVNGPGNPFHKRRMGGIEWAPGKQIEKGYVRVFIFDWRHHPEKTQEWYDRRKAKHEREGKQALFAQEVDRNYSAAVSNTIIQRAWLDACVDAHLKVQVLQGDEWMAGFDVGDQRDGDKNALSLRQGMILRTVSEWGERDPGVSVRNVLGTLRQSGRRGLKIQYDCIGPGAAVRSEYNRLIEAGTIDYDEFLMVPWHAGAKVMQPFARVVPDDDQSALNGAIFHNMRAQAWDAFATRCYKTFKAVTEGVEYRPDELVSFDRAGIGPLLDRLLNELSQPTRGTSTQSLKMLVNKTPDGTQSPNMADSVIQAYFPAAESGIEVEVGSY